MVCLGCSVGILFWQDNWLAEDQSLVMSMAWAACGDHEPVLGGALALQEGADGLVVVYISQCR
jgi:hypothetical protein